MNKWIWIWNLNETIFFLSILARAWDEQIICQQNGVGACHGDDFERNLKHLHLLWCEVCPANYYASICQLVGGN